MALTVPLERIEEKAVKADPRRAVLVVLLFLPFLIGWIARKIVLALAYAWSSVVAGWQEAARPRAEDGSGE